MKFEIKNKPDYASLHVVLDKDEQVVTEAGAMMAMSSGLNMESNMKGGLMGGLKRALAGESVIMNTYTATEDGQRLDVAPATPGDMVHRTLNGEGLVLQSGAYCACTPGVEIDSKWGGSKSFFSGEKMIMLRASGEGELWFTSYGAIHEVDVDGEYIVDTGHMVAFEETLTYNVEKVGGIKAALFSGEGLVCRFTGKGKLWIQTRNAPSLAAFVHPFRTIQSSN